MAHWYKPTGEPFYEVPNKSRGGTRPASITDARKVRAYPSVTAIIGIPEKTQLNRWKEDQMAMAALTYPGIDELLKSGRELKDILAIIRRDSQRQAKEAAERGTAVHDAIESFFKRRTVPAQHYATVVAAVELIEEECGPQEWEAEKWFASPLGYGGKIDLISPEWVIDFKTKPGDVSDTTMYDDQLMQLIAYDVGCSDLNKTIVVRRRKANVIVSRDIPGNVKWHSWDGADEEKQWNLFCLLLQYWQAKNDYFPHLEDAA
jgi:hypothetical protein